LTNVLPLFEKVKYILTVRRCLATVYLPDGEGPGPRPPPPIVARSGRSSLEPEGVLL